jgi:hypothetical protein
LGAAGVASFPFFSFFGFSSDCAKAGAAVTATNESARANFETSFM